MSTFKRGSEQKVSLATSLLKQIGVKFTMQRIIYVICYIVLVLFITHTAYKHIKYKTFYLTELRFNLLMYGLVHLGFIPFICIQYYSIYLPILYTKKYLFGSVIVLKENPNTTNTLCHSYRRLQTSTVRELSILFVFTPIENSMFPRRAIFATSFSVLHSSSHKHNQEKLP